MLPTGSVFADARLRGKMCSDEFRPLDCMNGVSFFLARLPRLETRLNPAIRSRLRTSRITWDRIALRALASLMRLELKSSS
jgi:hypothetical protein